MAGVSRQLRTIPPYDYQYRFAVTREFVGLTLLDFFCRRFNFKTREYWMDLIARGDATVNEVAAAATTTLAIDDVVHSWRRDIVEPPVNDAIEVLVDADGWFVVNKPAPLPVHPSGRYWHNSLTSILRNRYPEKKFHTLHRLDLWTTGILVLATDATLARHLHREVSAQNAGKAYGVLAIGDFGNAPFTVNEPIGRPGFGIKREFGRHIPGAKECATRFTPLRTLTISQGERGADNQLTLLKAEPLTGRTNQIRVHVRAAGGHVLNDPLYADIPADPEQIDFIGLHCREMRFTMPAGGEKSFTAPWPEGFRRYFPDAAMTAAFSL